MLRLFTFLEEAAGIELVLPVSPASYEWSHEAVIETVTVDQLGDLNFFGGKKMGATTLPSCILPAQAYPFLTPGAGTNPWAYLERLQKWIDNGTVVRFLVSGTPVNAAVLLEGVTYREQDGTNDLYADISIRQYSKPETPVLPAKASASTSTSRDSSTGAAETRSYTVQSGDTMWSICRKFYGDGSLSWRLAAANGVKNANLIYPGQTLTIPPMAQLPAAEEKPVSAKIAAASTVSIKTSENGEQQAVPQIAQPIVKSLFEETKKRLGGS